MISTLVVEDDYLIGHAVEQWLVKEGSVQWAQSVAAAKKMLDDTDFDIVLLDIGLPDGSGLDVLKYLKRRKSSVGILIMTAYGDIDNRVQGLDLGADDYLVKPIDFKELDARIRAVKRRKDGVNAMHIEHGNLSFDLTGMTVKLDSEPVHLSKKEVSILSILLQGQGRYYSRTMLEARLYDAGTDYEGNAIEVHISALRKKLGKSLIKTTRGLGYIIEKAESNE